MPQVPIHININTADIAEDEIMEISPDLLSTLLIDRTRSFYSDKTQNIVWGTDDYLKRGRGFAADQPILPAQITGRNNRLIRPRILKTIQQQKQRTEVMAEVFTPAWLCNSQNNLIDNEWFGKEGVFNKELIGNNWQSVPIKKLKLPKGKSWQEYVELPRLEMACGEAPYLVSRYDVTTGQLIPVCDRIGLLDRKLKLVNRFTDNKPTKQNKKTWRRWALKALQSIYGFDWQGDNVLLAREALLLTYIDFYFDKWGTLPLKDALTKPAEVISWNIWQMDGVQGTLPGAMGSPMTERKFMGRGLFDDDCSLCVIMEWQTQEPPTGKIIKFVDLMNN